MSTNLTTGDWAVIQVGRLNIGYSVQPINWTGVLAYPYSKYSIKETDFRTKTASFTSPVYIDLTEGVTIVRIVTRYHENFAGVILDVEYDEDTGMYTYQCQDWSRRYIGKFEGIFDKIKLYNILRWLITRGKVDALKPTAKSLNHFRNVLSGLRSLGMYNQKLYKGNIYSLNPFNQNVSLIARNKSFIEVIRGLVYSSTGFFDVYFNDRGVLQIEPLSKTAWEQTGLHLSEADYGNRKFKFSTTNAITGVIVNGTDSSGGSVLSSGTELGLQLDAFFGQVTASVDNQNKTSASTGTSKAVTTSKKNTTTSKTTSTNPYGTKKKKIWIGADGGSGSFTKEIISLLQKNGWSCHYSGEGAGVHYNDYWNVTSDYQVLAIVDNGFDPATVKEAYDAGSVKNTLASKKVTCMFFFDSRTWVDPNGMKPYRYGDFRNMYIPRAHDDNYSNFSGKLDVYNYFKRHNVRYCANPTAKGMVDQFLKGGLTCK